jgi:hypothetical protein
MAAGVSSLVVMVRLLTVGGWVGVVGSVGPFLAPPPLLQVQINAILSSIKKCFI